MPQEPSGWNHGYHQLSPESQQELYLQLMAKQELLSNPDYQRWLQNELEVTGRGLGSAEHQLGSVLPDQLVDAQIGHIGESAQEIFHAVVNDVGEVVLSTISPVFGKALNITKVAVEGPVGLLPFSKTGQELVEAGAEFPTTESIGINDMQTWRDTLQDRHDKLSAEGALTPEQLEGHLEELRTLDPGLRDLDAQASEQAAEQLDQIHQTWGWKAMQAKEQDLASDSSAHQPDHDQLTGAAEGSGDSGASGDSGDSGAAEDMSGGMSQEPAPQPWADSTTSARAGRTTGPITLGQADFSSLFESIQSGIESVRNNIP